MASNGTRIWAVAVIALSLSACHKAPEKAEKTNAPPSTVAPMGFAKTDGDASVTLTLPEPIKLYPELHTLLYNEGEATLTKFMADARKDRSEQSADGFMVPAYSHSIAWKISAQSPRLVSLYAEENDFQGGAHPSQTFQALLWDKAKDELVPTGKLFTNGADMSGIDSFLCKQIETERSKRAGEPVSQADFGDGCPKFADAKLILIPSTVNGKVGAVDALFGPSEVGAYAEGPYEIRVPASLLADALNPDYADQFGGDAVADNALSTPDTGGDVAQ
ncbi:MAG: DUF4163 domain-containing protein [Asticcacaulis sp.]|nr:DUF4163 domain-containing protein [Asticcacaulis sp.]